MKSDEYEKAREDFVERWVDPVKRSIARASFMAGWQACEFYGGVPSSHVDGNGMHPSRQGELGPPRSAK